MGEIINLSDRQPHVVVESDNVGLISVSDIRRLANGEISISEFEQPDEVGKCLALIAMDYMNAAD